MPCTHFSKGLIELVTEADSSGPFTGEMLPDVATFKPDRGRLEELGGSCSEPGSDSCSSYRAEDWHPPLLPTETAGEMGSEWLWTCGAPQGLPGSGSVPGCPLLPAPPLSAEVMHKLGTYTCLFPFLGSFLLINTEFARRTHIGGFFFCFSV